MSKTYTIAELEAMSDADLCALATELRGYRFVSPWLMNEDNEPVTFGGSRHWSPPTDRTQSGELLDWLTEQIYKANYMIKSGLLFKLIRIEWTDNKGDFQWVQVKGTSARSETIAFCAAMLAQQGRLK